MHNLSLLSSRKFSPGCDIQIICSHNRNMPTDCFTNAEVFRHPIRCWDLLTKPVLVLSTLVLSIGFVNTVWFCQHWFCQKTDKTASGAWFRDDNLAICNKSSITAFVDGLNKADVNLSVPTWGFRLIVVDVTVPFSMKRYFCEDYLLSGCTECHSLDGTLVLLTCCKSKNGKWVGRWVEWRWKRQEQWNPAPKMKQQAEISTLINLNKCNL